MFLSETSSDGAQKTKIEVMDRVSVRIIRVDYTRTEQDTSRYVHAHARRYRIAKENIFKISSEEWLSRPDDWSPLDEVPPQAAVRKVPIDSDADAVDPRMVAIPMNGDDDGLDSRKPDEDAAETDN
jgi:hypothetical protein